MSSFMYLCLQSGTPAAVNQLVVTQLVAPEGGADCLAAFLLVQYIFLYALLTLSHCIPVRLRDYLTVP